MAWVSLAPADSVEWWFSMQPNMPQAKTVLVTGAAKRLGKAIALDLAAHGWRIALHYHQSQTEALVTAAEIALLGPVACFQADLSQPQACETLFAQVQAHFGEVDALVNSASQFDHDDAQSFDPNLAQAHLAVNCVAPIVLARCLHVHLQARNADRQNKRTEGAKEGVIGGVIKGGVEGGIEGVVSGAVVNLLDQKLWNLNPDFLSYTLSKAALQAATTMMAQSFAPLLRVCGVAPGLTMPSYLQDSAAFAKAHQVSPLGRSSRPEDVARTVRFVLENESMTASQILVDGGQHLMHLPRDISFL
jgi:NAD(P)-dependent dehydrogenase (short-subunit alcohol dehydrogenase family)